MLSDSKISELYFEALGSQHLREQDRGTVSRFALAVEAEVRKDDESLIRQMLEALEREADSWKTDPERTKSAIAAARARLIDSDLSKLTERGAKAWAGVDPQKLREGEAP